VNAAVAAAARGDTVTVPAGSATWSSALTLTKGITLKGAGRDSTFITRSGMAISINPDAGAITNEETIRVEGFTFDGNNNTQMLFGVVGADASSNKPFKNLAIGNCRFRNMSNVTSSNAVIFNRGQTRGVIFGNIFDRCNVILKIYGTDYTTEWSNGHFPQSYGTADNLYFENNTIQYSTTYSGGDPGWIESGQGGRLVVRYNTFNFTNATCSEYWDIHGFQYFPDPNASDGTFVVEYYGNTLTSTSGYRWIAHRGGWGLFFNNILTGTNSGSINAMQYPGGMTADVAGASGHYICEVNNSYFFNNTRNGTVINAGWAGGGSPLVTVRLIFENANWWNYNASFDGSTGIGRGTTTPTMTATNGVGYWKCSTPTPTTDPAIVQTGHFYKRVAGAWVDYYTPYTYPHPLVSGAGPSPTPTPTPAPTPTPTATPTPAPLGISFASTAGNITSPFVVNSNTISQSLVTVDPTQGGRALYTFAVPSAGDYALSAKVNCPDEGSNSFFVNIDGEPSSAMIWNIPVTTGPENRIATWSPSTTPKVWTLNTGIHQLIIRGREADSILGQITLSLMPSSPDGLHIVP
jgi:hypothetical protein